jgi:CRP-like cAMP-binding protein
MNIPPDKQKYADLIRQLIPINELPQEVQNQIIVKGDIFELKKKDLIFNQGDRDNYSYYLLDGEIELEANKQVHNAIVGKTDRARYPMAQLQPRQFSGKARVASTVLRLDRDVLDKLLVMHQSKNVVDDGLGDGSGIVELDEIDGVDDEGDWMTRMLQSEIFSGMPTANIHQLFGLLEPVEYKTGESVIRQGESGNHYYIIQEGRCEVLRQSIPGGKAMRLAELHPGDSFGEEALIAETTRNATIRMLTDGVVAQLSKENFVTLIQKQVLKAVSSGRAAEIVKAGGKWLDVRFKNEYDRNTIEGCEHIPMNILRLKLDKLDRNVHYVLFCDTGGRSSTAAFLLTDGGFTASYLDGGLVNHPELAPPEDVTQAPKVPAAPAPRPVAATSPAPEPPPKPMPTTPVVKPAASGQAAAVPKPAVKPESQPQVKPETKLAVKPSAPPTAPAPTRVEPAARPAPVTPPAAAAPAPAPVIAPSAVAEDDDGDMDPEIMATVLEAELTRTNFQIERARQQDQTEQKNIETARRLEQERAKIEEAKKRVEEDVRRLRLEEETRLKKMEQEAAQRLELERRKIEEVYTRNAEEMEKLERLKHEAEESLKLEKERIERDAEEARKGMQDVEKIRQELEAARKAMEQEAERRRLEQDEMRKQIEAEARQNIEIERGKLAEQIARNNQEMEKAKQDRNIAEAGRAAARQEAELMIQEYKSQHEKSRADEEAQLRAERMKLEEEQKNIQKVLQEIQKTRAEAVALKRAALAEVSALKARQFQEDIARNEVARNELKDKIKQAQDKLIQATEKVAKVEKDEEQAVVARNVNEEDLLKKKAEEETLRRQLEADLSEFKEELEVQEREYANASTQLEHMRRIKERAESAKKAAEDASRNLLSDVASQLGDK